jgi:IS5 family transposase
MRKKREKQLPLLNPTPAHPKAGELETISKILDQNPTICEMSLQDLTSKVNKKENGANGMTAEQVLRAAIIKQMEGYSYEEPAFHLLDSHCYRNFCKIGITQKGFKKSALCNNIKAISPQTWEKINKTLVGYARDEGIEKGKKVRIDSTVVSSHIHEPTDSGLLWDSVRVIARILAGAKGELPDLRFPCQDHTRRAKRRMLGIMNAGNEKNRKQKYGDLLKITRRTIGYAQAAIPELQGYIGGNLQQMFTARGCRQELEHYVGLALQVVEQTERRVLKRETVSASEKIVSIFEPHADIIKKDRRDTFYGHKVCLAGGSSNLILDCLILEGNPADSTLCDEMFDRQKDIYARYPAKAALDGGFASKDNLKSSKAKGIKDVCFAKGRSLKEEDMCRNRWVYKVLRKFRAGIESGISWLKRCFGLGRCLWKGFSSFKSYVWSAIVSANLLTIARKQLA